MLKKSILRLTVIHPSITYGNLLKHQMEIIKPKTPVPFKARFKDALMNPSFLFMQIIYVIISFKIPLFIVFPIIFSLSYSLWLNKKLSKYIVNIELIDEELLIHFVDRYSIQHSIKIPIQDVTVDHVYGSKIPPYMAIEEKWKTRIKQFATLGWSRNDLKETTERIKEIKRRVLTNREH